jgi:hypothetical protein
MAFQLRVLKDCVVLIDIRNVIANMSWEGRKIWSMNQLELKTSA